jgi:hypothetical protein
LPEDVSPSLPAAPLKQCCDNTPWVTEEQAKQRESLVKVAETQDQKNQDQDKKNLDYEDQFDRVEYQIKNLHYKNYASHGCTGQHVACLEDIIEGKIGASSNEIMGKISTSLAKSTSLLNRLYEQGQTHHQ